MAISQERLLALVQGFKELSTPKKMGIIAATLTVIGVMIGLILWSQAVEYKTLYTNLSEKDGGEVLAALQQQNIPYKVSENGGSILIPAAQVYEIRLRLASQGIPKGGSTGFELMENQKLGISQFAEQVNYQRALEGEIARSIETINAVKSARVHLAIPKPTVFVREQLKPSASVVLHLHNGRVLDPTQVNGILNLISSSVPELPTRNVTIVDQNGTLLTSNEDAVHRAGLNPTQIEYVRQVEKTFSKRIEDIVGPITGQSNVRAQVTADIDFSQTEQTSESYRPNQAPEKASVRSTQTTEVVENNNPPVGVPGALSNQPPGAATAPLTTGPGQPVQNGGTTGNSRRENTTNYEVDKTIQHTKGQSGSIKRLSVAVVVNYRKTVETDGTESFKPLSPQEMTQLNNLVREAMGYQKERGDTLNIVNASFNIEKDEEPFWQRPGFFDLIEKVGRFAAITAIFLYLIFGVIRPMIRKLMTPTPPPEVALEGMGVEGGPALPPGTQMVNGVLMNLDGTPYVPKLNTYEEKLAHVRSIAKENPRLVATIIKEWIDADG